MDQSNLVDLQQNVKKIRNPFGFDFTVKYAGRPITLSGDGNWYTILAPLADHIANRLYMKVRYQYHDEQVAALKAKGDDKGARGYSVPIEVENKISMLITGLPKHTGFDTAENVEDAADLTELKNELKAMEKKASINNGPINISRILDKANVEALPVAQAVEGKSSSGHRTGSASLSDEIVPEKDTTPVNVADLNPEEIVPQAPVKENTIPVDEPQLAQAVEAKAETQEEFADVQELDGQQPQQQTAG